MYLIHFKARDFPYSSRMASNFQEVFNFTTRKRGQNAMLFAFGKMCCVIVDLQQQKKQEKRRFPNNQLPLLRICYMVFCFLSVNLALFGQYCHFSQSILVFATMSKAANLAFLITPDGPPSVMNITVFTSDLKIMALMHQKQQPSMFLRQQNRIFRHKYSRHIYVCWVLA